MAGFEYIPKTNAETRWGFIDSEEKFYRFVEEYNIVKVWWSQPVTISASYFLRLLQEGSSARARGFSKRYTKEDDEHSEDLRPFYGALFDHGALWRESTGKVICTAMPYRTKDEIINAFFELKTGYNYPDSIKLKFLDEKYRYRQNGYEMIMIYDDPSEDGDDSFIYSSSDEQIKRKAIQYSSPDIDYTQKTAYSYTRNRYISEYAKRRAKGICQLCGNPAPFLDETGKPFLETHHVIWLADGGTDSIENTVALCPNCHRKMHTLNLESDIQKLLAVAKDE